MMFDATEGDALISYFFTYDKRLQDIRECYSLQALAINPHTYSVFPIYVMVEGFEIFFKSIVLLENIKNE